MPPTRRELAPQLGEVGLLVSGPGQEGGRLAAGWEKCGCWRRWGRPAAGELGKAPGRTSDFSVTWMECRPLGAQGDSTPEEGWGDGWREEL